MLRNLRLGGKLMIWFIMIVVVSAGVLGGLGYFNINRMSSIIHEITNQRVPSVKNSTAVERYTLRAILNEKQYIVALNDENIDETTFQQSVMTNIDEINKSLDSVDAVATQYNDQDLLAESKEIRTVTAQYKDLSNSTAAKYQDNKKLVKVMEENGAKVTAVVKNFFGDKARKTDKISIEQVTILVDIWNTVFETRLNQNQYMLTRNAEYWTALQGGIKALVSRYDDLQEITTDPFDLLQIQQARTATDEYFTAAQAWVTNDNAASAALKQMADLGTKVQDTAMKAEDAGWAATETSKATALSVVSASGTFTLIAVIVALVLGVVMGVLIPRSIVRPVNIVAAAAEGISEGDLDQIVNIHSRDEIGSMARSFEKMIAYMKGMATTAESIASGDLSVNVEPISERDVLGNAFAKMVTYLNSTMGQVAESANSLGTASEQLASAAGQAGQATMQISKTVQQVAEGTSQQADATGRTARAMEQMTRAIDGVARGAQEQSQAASTTTQITEQISRAVQQVAGNAEAVSLNSAEAAKAAREGAKTVEATIQGMRNIQTKVGLSAQKVEEMGKRSDQIGVIVETIDDIASQTNLLALNAAIEAARAGEHGKGFAVVADEVRKLAERSSSATKEINGLIRGIQKTVAEAVKAMNEGSVEVEAGVGLANDAGQSLANILNAAETVFKQADEAAKATHRMNSLANEMVAAADTVSSIVEENTASTEQMSANSAEVTQAIENIASVSEENSASAEEVSASAEEMSAQVEEVTASALNLSETAQELKELVAQFKLRDASDGEAL
jgi:methyl-accepting chemotaxis protein